LHLLKGNDAITFQNGTYRSSYPVSGRLPLIYEIAQAQPRATHDLFRPFYRS